MYKVVDRLKMSEKFTDYKALNVVGILRNTSYDAYVDDLENPSSIWIKDRYFSFLYTSDETFIKNFDENINETFYAFSGTTDAVLEYYKSNKLMHWQNTCNQYHYEGGKFDDVLELETLSLEDAEYVNEHYEYKNDHSLEKIKDCILNRPTSCLRVDGKLVSYVMLHDDDSIGFMFTLPEYRGKGYAYELTKDIINKTIDSGRLPYVQIVHGNVKSMGLAEKIGFKKHGEVHWFGTIVDGDELRYFKKKYYQYYGDNPSSMSVKLTLNYHVSPLDVKVNEKTFEHEGVYYEYQSHYHEEIYYVHSDMPSQILVSGLMKLIKEDFDMVFSNQRLDESYFIELSAINEEGGAFEEKN